MDISTDELSKILVNKWDYEPSQAPQTAKKLLELESDIKNAFVQWYNTGEFSSQPAYEGYSPKMLAEFETLKPPAVFLLLDWLRREPVEARAAIEAELE